MLKKILSAAVTAVMLAAFTGCSAGTAATHGPDSDTICFTDALGREVKVPSRPKRVAALIGSFADVWMLAGGTLCAAAEEAWNDFNLELGDAVNLGGAHSQSLEKLLASDPDFVLASASTVSNTDMLEVLESAGITTAYFDVDCFEDYLEMLDICCRITGRQDLFQRNGLSVQKRIQESKAEFASAGLPERERTVLLLRASSTSVKAKGSSGTILGEMLSDLGCINIADSDKTLLDTLSVESIIRREPYRIFVVTMGDDTDKALSGLAALMEKNPAWLTLEAVRESRLYLLDRKLFNIKPNAKWADSYEKLCNILLDKAQ